MKVLYIVLLLIAGFTQSRASDSLYVQLNKHEFKKNDTILVNCNWNTTKAEYKNVTLHIVLENTNKKSRNEFRYPMVDGASFANIIIGEDIPAGNYAMHFLVQKAFPQLEGKITNYSPKTTALNYMMLLKNKPAYIGMTNVDYGGHFKTAKIAFPDSANFMFFEIGKKKSDINIEIKNNVDSLFQPIISTHEFIAVDERQSAIDSNYQFNISEKIENKMNTLATVTVKSKIKKQVQLFDEQYSTGLFQGGDPTIFDGIEDESISRSFDVFTFIQTRLPGITKKTNDAGVSTLHWRNQPINVYLDEFKVDDEYISMINVNDIAMIKVYSPFSGGPSNSGAIAIYTRRGIYELPSKRKFNFLIKGFSQSESYWHL